MPEQNFSNSKVIEPGSSQYFETETLTPSVNPHEIYFVGILNGWEILFQWDDFENQSSHIMWNDHFLGILEKIDDGNGVTCVSSINFNDLPAIDTWDQISFYLFVKTGPRYFVAVGQIDVTSDKLSDYIVQNGGDPTVLYEVDTISALDTLSNNTDSTFWEDLWDKYDYIILSVAVGGVGSLFAIGAYRYRKKHPPHPSTDQVILKLTQQSELSKKEKRDIWLNRPGKYTSR